MNIRGKTVLLRAIERSDLSQIQTWSNDPDLQPLLGGFHFPSSREVMEAWFERTRDDPRNLRFAIDAPDIGLIGTCNLVEIDWKDRNAFHGMLLGAPAARGKGYGVDTVMAIMRYAFEELGLERLDGSIIEYNEASKRLYLGKCGWSEEGRKRRAYFRKNRFWDKLVVGILREDYLSLAASTRYWEAPGA